MVNIDMLLIMADFFAKATVASIVLQEVRHRIWLGKLVHRNHLNAVTFTTFIHCT
ncbi:Uncharacterised protein [Vibrio cholerae]|nr:Uncharacterised protein [Vibrio cholerae]